MADNVVYPVMGGAVELAAAMEFTGQDQQTGAPKQVSLPDRIVVTHGRKKSTLDGFQVQALVDIYKKEADFRAWVEKCK